MKNDSIEKECKKCSLIKPASEFWRDKRAKTGLRTMCKDCERDYRDNKLYGGLTLKEYRRKRTLSYLADPEGRKRHNEKARAYYQKRKQDQKYVVTVRMRRSQWDLLRARQLNKVWTSKVGYTSDDLVRHLEGQFDEHMSWDNYGTYWEIDHIKPISLFNYTSVYDQEFKDCWSLDNLQPLEKRANFLKGNSYSA